MNSLCARFLIFLSFKATRSLSLLFKTLEKFLKLQKLEKTLNFFTNLQLFIQEILFKGLAVLSVQRLGLEWWLACRGEGLTLSADSVFRNRHNQLKTVSNLPSLGKPSKSSGDGKFTLLSLAFIASQTSGGKFAGKLWKLWMHPHVLSIQLFSFFPFVVRTQTQIPP